MAVESKKKRILVICIHNSARSQMAEEYIRKFTGGRVFVESAGIEPGKLNPDVVKLLQEEGIDISCKKTQKALDLYERGNRYDYVITVCSDEARERCPLYPGVTRRLHWPFPDPSALRGADTLEQTRVIRDLIKKQVKEFVQAELL